MRVCDHNNCTKFAKFNPVLKIWAMGQNKSHKPARAVISLGLCAAHMETAKVDDFLDDDGWRKFMGGFVENNHAMPDRASCELGKQKIKIKNIRGH